MTERIENYARIIGKYLELIGTYSDQSDLYTWIVTNHNIVVYTLEKVVTTVIRLGSTRTSDHLLLRIPHD